MVAIYTGEANRLIREVGRTFAKNSFSNCSNVVPSPLGERTDELIPRDLVVPVQNAVDRDSRGATVSTSPLDAASNAILVTP